MDKCRFFLFSGTYDLAITFSMGNKENIKYKADIAHNTQMVTRDFACCVEVL